MSENKEPIPTFKGLNHPINRCQFHWLKVSDGYEIALFAGKEIEILELDTDTGDHRLSYLDMRHPDNFKTIEDAKAVAHDFAKQVLQQMIDMIDQDLAATQELNDNQKMN